jgi:hypothetical protein
MKRGFELKSWMLWAVCLTAILGSFSSYFIWGESSFLSIGDGLDSNHVQCMMAAENTQRFGHGNPQTITAKASYGEFVDLIIAIPGLQEVLYIIFQPYYADVINRVIISLVAFFGMLLLLRYLYPQTNYPGNDTKLFGFGVSLAFALLRFWPYAGISVAGLPLIYWAYLNAGRKPLWSALIALLFALYSSLALVGIFVLAVLVVHEAVFWLKKRGDWYRVLWILLLGVFYIFANLGMVLSVLAPVTASHRSGFNVRSFFSSNRETLTIFLKMLFLNYGHNSSYPWIIMPGLILAVILGFKHKLEDRHRACILLVVWVALAMISAAFGNRHVYDIQAKLGFLKMIQLQRFYWLLPFVQYLAFMVALQIFVRARLRVLAMILLAIQICLLGFYFNYNTKQCVKEYILNKQVSALSYDEFYSPDLFKDIKNYIGKPQTEYRVASLGLNPATAIYNGFYTVDGYFSGGYPLKHKYMFAEVIEDELEKDDKLAQLFYDWGSTCYLFSSEIEDHYGYNGNAVPIIDKTSSLSISDLDIDTEQLEHMNCKYIFSALPIDNQDELNLSFIKSFEEEKSPYRIYLYSIENDDRP